MGETVGVQPRAIDEQLAANRLVPALQFHMVGTLPDPHDLLSGHERHAALTGLGVTVRAVTDSVARTRRLPASGGFLVTSVELGGPATEAPT